MDGWMDGWSTVYELIKKNKDKYTTITATITTTTNNTNTNTTTTTDTITTTTTTFMMRWVVGSILHGRPIELFLVRVSAPRLV